MKKFIDANTMRNNALLLAHKIHKDGFIPDVIYVSLRGGALLGNVISEYFKIVRGSEHPVFYAALVARSYTGVGKKESIRIDGWTYDPRYLRHGDKVLLIDDIFDSGVTVNHLVGILELQGVPRADIRIAVHDYKCKDYNVLEQTPDYFCNKYDISRPEEDLWVHYMTHELMGLSEEDIARYYAGNSEIQDILRHLRRIGSR